MFSKSQGSFSLAIELLDTEEENSDEPADAEVRIKIMRIKGHTKQKMIALL